ncbi:uncharacterized protein LOC133779795 [Humulus lupulus]|uniref:uncharacterized protein LOC133779795 n=1 Tax=Humulus lupulus TaxID=3486 RepID=UPI002B40363E|nr:uncharacterized protein LOC133779795 [Humulus lupulus]
MDLNGSTSSKVHTTPYSLHLGSSNMYNDLKALYWWPGMKRDIAEYVMWCLAYQQVKAKHQMPACLLQPISIPEWKWEDNHGLCGSWSRYLPLIEFSYKNSYQFTIGMAPYEMLHGRKCRTPLHWDEVGEKHILGKEEVREATEAVIKIRQGMMTTQSIQKSYANLKRRKLEFLVSDQVLLRVSPMKGVMHFGKNGKLSPWYMSPFKILEKVEQVDYHLALPPALVETHNV